jgi:Ca-activated chloride channel homolog
MKRHAILAFLLAFVSVVPAFADGLIVPIRPEIRIRGSWAVRYHKVDIKVRDQVADVSIDEAFVNTGGSMIEVEYLFPLPPSAAIDSLTLLVDGKEFKGRILRAEEARRAYEEIVRLKRDPALLEYVNYGLYRTSAFPLLPGKEARVVIHYTDVCRKDSDVVEVLYPLNTEKFSARPIDEVEVKVDIQGKSPISTVYSPTHSVIIERPSPDHVISVYKEAKVIPTMDFRLIYRPAKEAVEATVLSYRPRPDEAGYYLLMVSPTPRADKVAVVPKDLVILLDHSGSMAGEKVDQAKASLAYVLRNLNPADTFNVIVYNDVIDSLFPGLVPNQKENIEKALTMIDRIKAEGGTNIHDALTAALKAVSPAVSERRSRYILFLTDGQPTVGQRDERTILADTAAANAVKARIFAMGIGYDVNVRLLDKVVGQNRGVSSYVKEKEPLEPKISSLYGKIKNPIMTEVSVAFGGAKTNMAYPQPLPDLFDGDQIIQVGRYEQPGPVAVAVTGAYMGKNQIFRYNAELANLSDRFSYAFVEQLWAVRRIGFLLDEIQLNGRSNEVVDELVRLSKLYGIITPYTSFLADERTNLASLDELRRKGVSSAEQAVVVTGGIGQMNAANRAALNQATVAPAQSAGGGGGGYAAQIGQSNVVSYEANQTERLANVQTVGNRALYRRGQQWIDSTVADKPADTLNIQARTIVQFSEEYFKLVTANNLVENQMLATQQPGEELILSLRGQLYRITPAAIGK